MPKIIENVREQLIGEAKRQIAENGYAQTTIRSVAKACGLGVGTVYLDVNFAKEKGSADGEYGNLGEGAMLSYSAVTSMKFTRFIHETATGNNLSVQSVNEMTYTGTNADVAAKVGLGTASAVLSIPVKYMHSSVETADMNDVITCAEILKETALAYDVSPVCKPVYFKRGGAKNELC